MITLVYLLSLRNRQAEVTALQDGPAISQPGALLVENRYDNHHTDLISRLISESKQRQIGWVNLLAILRERIVIDGLILDGEYRHSALKSHGDGS